MTHTPGPWRFNGNWLEPVDGGELILAYTNADDGLHGTDEDKALLAAAPDLLAALAALVDKSTDTEGDWSNEWRAALDAIAKARSTPSLHIEVL